MQGGGAACRTAIGPRKNHAQRSVINRQFCTAGVQLGFPLCQQPRRNSCLGSGFGHNDENKRMCKPHKDGTGPQEKKGKPLPVWVSGFLTLSKNGLHGFVKEQHSGKFRTVQRISVQQRTGEERGGEVGPVEKKGFAQKTNRQRGPIRPTDRRKKHQKNRKNGKRMRGAQVGDFRRGMLNKAKNGGEEKKKSFQRRGK